MTLLAHFPDKGMHVQRIDNLPNGQIAVVLQHKCRSRNDDAAQHKAPRSLSMLGIPAADVQQIDLHRLSRKGPDAGPIRTWSRRPHLKVALDLPAD